MMKNLKPDEENIIKKTFCNRKKIKEVEDRILMDMKYLFEEYYKPVRLNNFWSNNYIEYKSRGVWYKTLSVEEHLDKIRLYLKDIINNLQKSYTWKIQLSIIINFFSSKGDRDEERVIYLKCDNIKVIFSDEADEATEELFNSLKNRCQNSLERKLRSSEFVFDHVQLLYYKYHKINLNRGGSYIDSVDCIKTKTQVKLWRNKKNPQRITKTKPFMNTYNWEGINYSSEKDDWKKFEKNNVTIAINVLYAKKEKIYAFSLCFKT